MCGFFEFDKNLPKAKRLLRELDIEGLYSDFRPNLGTGPASSIDIIANTHGQTSVLPATWWLLLDRDTLKPSKYTSFNTRSDKLNVPRSAGYQAYRQHRCIIPATGIVEGEGTKGNRKYHLIEPMNTAFALGGLYKEWINKATGEHAYSCSIITLPPHSHWEGIHSKSTPIFLPTDKEIIRHWLDPEFTEVALFNPLLEPAFQDQLLVTEVDRPSTRSPLSDSFII